MKHAFFICGFANWGKSYIIRNIFGKNEYGKFSPGKLYKLDGTKLKIEFTVVSFSNDDYRGTRWLKLVDEKIKKSPDKGKNLIAALCPSMEWNNNFIELLKNKTFKRYDILYIFLIEEKWEQHSKLMTKNIIEQGREIPNAKFITINAGQDEPKSDIRKIAKTNQIIKELNKIFKA